MPKIVPITLTDFAGKRWQRYVNYSFAARDSFCPLVMQELPKAQLSLPIGFVIINQQLTPVAVLGLKPGMNAFVDSNGRWIGQYIPVAYRGYPFVLANTDKGRQALCFDQDSELITAGGGEAFFTDNGELANSVKAILNVLTKVHSNREMTLRICTVLQEKKLIEPWTIQLKTDEGEIPVKGLYRIDEEALNKLDKDNFEDLRQAGALSLIYCQLLSMQHLPSLAKFTVQRQKDQCSQVPDIEQLFGEKDDLFKF